MPDDDRHRFFMPGLMAKVLNISNSKTMLSIVTFGALNAAIFISLVLAYKYLGLLHFWGLRVTNYVVFIVSSLVQLRRLIARDQAVIPFLGSFILVLFTGVVAFALYAVFIFIYSFADPDLAEMFITGADQAGHLTPAVIVFFEGSGASIVVALVGMVYTSRFEDGESGLPG